jgi:hypothetical protein
VQLAEQEPEPLQVKPPAHSLSGSVLAVMFPQVPVVPPVLAFVQALQVPVQVLLQQTPSTQWLPAVEQSWSPVESTGSAAQAAPCATFRTQEPPEVLLQ